MALAAGVKLGPYEILSPLGVGGMGEVYRARDGRLHREVAVKVLPESLANDPPSLARFEREARAIANLSHPNILSIFDFGKDGATVFMAMELLEGETLRSRLDPGALPFRKGVEMGRDIARGLAAAHEKGIVHRDLKPENIFVTRDGHVKILDFGLARAVAPLSADVPSSNSPSAVTTPSALLGTVGYMSPEQLGGEPADARSDIFAFGAVLYEMLSGRRAFRGKTSIETLHAILHDDPPEIASSGRSVPVALERLVRRCLEKKPDERYRSAYDLAFDLDVLSGLSAPADTVAAFIRGKKIARAPALAAAVALAVGVVLVVGRQSKGPSIPRFQQITFRRGTIASARFAPDERTVLFSAAWDGEPLQVWTKVPESPDATPRNLLGANLLAVSRSGELAAALECRVAVDIAQNKCRGTLSRLPMTEGAPRAVAKEIWEADWNPAGTDLAVVRQAGNVSRLEFPLGKTLFETHGYVSDLRFSAKGDLIAFFEHPLQGDDRGDVAVVDLEGRKRTLSKGWESLYGLAWAPSGEVWFTGATAGYDWALYGVSLSGRRRPVLAVPGGVILRDVSPSGRVLLTKDEVRFGIRALAPGETKERDLSWLEGSYEPRLSEDGTKLLFTEEGEAAGPNYAVCLRKTNGSPVIRLGDGSGWDLSPDGKWALTHLPESNSTLVLLSTGAGERRIVKLPEGLIARRGRFFPDGKRLLLYARQEGHGWRHWVLDLGGGSARPVTPEGARASGALSSDGRWFAAAVEGKLLAFPVEGGNARPIPGAAKGDVPVCFGGDGRSLYLWEHTSDIPLRLRLSRLDLETGSRVIWKELMPPDPAGIIGVSAGSLTADGRHYAYTYARFLSDMFVADGLK